METANKASFEVQVLLLGGLVAKTNIDDCCYKRKYWKSRIPEIRQKNPDFSTEYEKWKNKWFLPPDLAQTIIMHIHGANCSVVFY